MEDQATTLTDSELMWSDLWRAYKSNPNDITSRNRIIEYYMPLVRKRAERIRAKLPREIELDDLISAGTVGLIDAVRAFEPERGVKFETFCIPRVQGAMLDELRAMDWAPRMVRSRTSKLHEADKILVGKFGRKPSEEELASFLEMPVDDVRQTIHDSNRINMTSLDKKWNDQSGDSEITEIDVLQDRRNEAPTERLERTELIRQCTQGLNQKERLIIILYYYEDMTMKEIGAALDLSESRVSQMHSSIVKRMRRKLDRSMNYDR
ncbi:MAG: FliA/WhiG family RNA polymerase sigma factor [Planctomycetia bacterium]|nr:FliA/WhiG family RNA polymerase sigma factor [Planctomycetia bacterium]